MYNIDATDPVEYFSPSLHGYALVDRQHGESNIVKVGYSIVGTLPAGPTNRAIDHAAATVSSLSAGCRKLTFCRGIDTCAPVRERENCFIPLGL